MDGYLRAWWDGPIQRTSWRCGACEAKYQTQAEADQCCRKAGNPGMIRLRHEQRLFRLLVQAIRVLTKQGTLPEVVNFTSDAETTTIAKNVYLQALKRE